MGVDWDGGWRPGTLVEFGGALRDARERMGMTLEGLAGVTGVSKPYLSNIETGRLVGPASEEKLRVIAGALGLGVEGVLMAADWLRTPAGIRALFEGEGGDKETGRQGDKEMGVPRRGDGAIDLDALWGNSKLKTQNSKPGEGAGAGGAEAGVLGVRKIPLINRVAAGRPGEFGDLDYPRGVGDAYVEAPAVEGGEAPDMPGEAAVCSFALKVSGDSMSPTYGEGEIVFVGTGEARDGDDCVVRMGETQGYATTFKRVYFVREAGGEVTGVRLVPLNPAYGEWVVSLEEVSGIYPVVYRLVPVRGAKGKGEGREGLSLEHD